MKATLRARLTRLPPVRWFLAVEDGVFRLAGEAEYRLGITPRTTKIVPGPFDRLVMRVVLLFVPVLIGTFVITTGATRTRTLLAIIGVAVLLFTTMWVIEGLRADRGTTRRPPTPRPFAQPQPPRRPPARRL
jgi:hypothetical protein